VLFAFEENRIAVQFFYEWNERVDGKGQWWRTYGLEVSSALVLGCLSDIICVSPFLLPFRRPASLPLSVVPLFPLPVNPSTFAQDWTFAPNGLMRKRMMSGNDVKISEDERWFKDGVDVDSVDISEKHL
jgi:uncharacterized protein